MAMKPLNRWLDRRVAAPGPYLTLCLSQEEFDAALKHCKQPTGQPWISTDHAHATAHFMTNNKQGVVAIVCLSSYEGRDPIEVAGLLVHEAVHVWQEYAYSIGETTPGREQEAYAVQAIAQELMAEYARRIGARS